ncbi:MAG: hypothetical protein NZ561_03705 [Phycisphaerae bacterium]|nr:hypothetical protein [Phycisphaerae bacterium]
MNPRPLLLVVEPVRESVWHGRHMQSNPLRPGRKYLQEARHRLAVIKGEYPADRAPVVNLGGCFSDG